MKYYSVLLLFCLFGIQDLSAQIIFDYQYPLEGTNKARSLKSTPLGYIIGGSKLLSVDKNGQELLTIANSHNRANFVEIDSGYVIVNNIVLSSGKIRGYIARYDQEGNELWYKIITSAYWKNFTEDILALEDGTFLYTGRHSSVTSSGAILRKLNGEGNTIWENKWNSDEYLSTYGREVFLSEQSIFVLGRSSAGSGGTSEGRDIFISKHDAEGEGLNWMHVFGTDSTEEATDALILDDDNVLILGYSDQDETTLGNRGLLLSLTGDSISATRNWVKHYPSDTPEQFNAIETAPDNGYLILGTRGEEVVDSVKTFLMKVDENGDAEWEYIFASAGHHHKGVEMLRESNSVYVIGGYYEDETLENRNYFLTKFDVTNLNDLSSNVIENNNNDIDLKLYPNPVNELLSIDIQTNLGAKNNIRVMDMTGRLVDEFSFHSPKLYYDCSALESGMYVIEIEVGEKRIIRKFVVK